MAGKRATVAIPATDERVAVWYEGATPVVGRRDIPVMGDWASTPPEEAVAAALGYYEYQERAARMVIDAIKAGGVRVYHHKNADRPADAEPIYVSPLAE